MLLRYIKVLMRDVDVVPVNPESVGQWTHPPFSGHFDGTLHLACSRMLITDDSRVSGERVWGRGSSDDKSGLIGIM